MNILPFPALSLALRSGARQGVRGYLPCKHNPCVFPDRKNVGFLASWYHEAVLAVFLHIPEGDMRVLAAIGLPHRTHNAVSGDRFCSCPAGAENKKTAISP